MAPLPDGELAGIIMQLKELASHLEVQDISFSRWILRSIALLVLTEDSFSAAIDRLAEDEVSLSKRLARLRQVEEEMKHHLAALRHERNLLIKYMLSSIHKNTLKYYRWNHAIVPSPSNELGLETAAVLERRKEVTVKKAKDAYTELETLNVRSALRFTAFTFKGA